jgi:hypothetical protein
VRTLDLGFAAHIEGGATTLATCWKIVRTDEAVFGFTDHDQVLRFGGTDYLPMLMVPRRRRGSGGRSTPAR